VEEQREQPRVTFEDEDSQWAKSARKMYVGSGSTSWYCVQVATDS
jgi:hypothetical protein